MMKRLFLICLIFYCSLVLAQESSISAFDLTNHEDIKLVRPAQPFTPFDKCGRRFALLGQESGCFEAWAYPLKLFRDCRLSFFIGESTTPIRSEHIVRRVEVTPAVTSIIYTYQSFTVKAHFITSINEPGAVILLEVRSTQHLSIVCGFLPVLQPMWPGGLGGQYAFWNGDVNAYVISESTRKNHGIIGSPAANGLSYTPAHMLSDAPNEFRIDIPEPSSVIGRFIPVAMAGGQGTREEIITIYQKIIADPQKIFVDAKTHYSALRKRTLSIYSPVVKIDRALEWAKIAYDNLVVDHPTLGTGLVAGLGASGSSGRPGFGWFFGGDTYINSFSLNSYNDYQTTQQVLAFMTKFQRDDGKMAHEISQAVDYVDWFGDYPYGYIHGDTSPYFIVAVYDYVAHSGDLAFLKKHWNTLRGAWDWSVNTDQNNDGLMDNSAAGLGALEYGKLTGGIATDIYLGAVWTRAAQVMPKLARWIGEESFAQKIEPVARKAEKAFKEKFWDKENSIYAYAFGNDGSHVKSFSPWNAVGLMWELGEPERSAMTLSRLASSTLMTDWGVRSISSESEYYEALNYNYGAVWPFLNSWVATALYKHHFSLQGWMTLRATVEHVYLHQLGAVGEVFSGSLFTWPQESVPHQGFSTAGTVLPLVRGLFGLEGNALEKTIQFAPHCPADWKRYVINNYQVGNTRLDFEVERKDSVLTVDIHSESLSNYTLQLAPAFGPGTEIVEVESDGQSMPFDLDTSNRYLQPRFRLPLTKSQHRVVFKITPTVEILPPEYDAQVGDVSKGLRILSMSREADNLRLVCEGLSGMTYSLGVTRPDLIQSASEAALEGDRLIIQFTENEEIEYVKKMINIRCRN